MSSSIEEIVSMSPTPTFTSMDVFPSNTFSPSIYISAGPMPTNGTNYSGGGNGQSNQSSPLLFFVALGFGVVFTNLWWVLFIYFIESEISRAQETDCEQIGLSSVSNTAFVTMLDKGLGLMGKKTRWIYKTCHGLIVVGVRRN